MQEQPFKDMDLLHSLPIKEEDYGPFTEECIPNALAKSHDINRKFHHLLVVDEWWGLTVKLSLISRSCCTSVSYYRTPVCPRVSSMTCHPGPQRRRAASLGPIALVFSCGGWPRSCSSEFIQIEAQLAHSYSLWEIMKVGFIVGRCLAQSTGVLVVNNYPVTLYNTLGFYGSMPLLLYEVYTTGATLLNFSGSLVVDRFGLGVATLFLSIFVTFYGSCGDAISDVYCVELFLTRLRAGPKVNIENWNANSSCFVLFLFIVYTEVAPVAFNSIGWKYYLVFIILPLIGTHLYDLLFQRPKICSWKKWLSCLVTKLCCLMLNMHMGNHTEKQWTLTWMKEPEN
ncbi:hypothetical protein N7486_004800 [Penicillium sp. IBT 16267x]|nr:hypothetical protein N7486_004800 [Penicillium sp. IBT 16267x]